MNDFHIVVLPGDGIGVEIMDACLKATNELWAEISAKNEDFKRLITEVQAFRNDEYFWWQVAEYGFDTFMIRSRTRG